jgi:hypothetical protein
MGESEKGARRWAVAFIGAAGGRGRGGSTAASAWKRETGGEGGGLVRWSVAGTSPWLMGAGGRCRVGEVRR